MEWDGEKLTYRAGKEDSTGFNFTQIRTGSHVRLTKHDSSSKTIHKKVFMYYMTPVFMIVKKETREIKNKNERLGSHCRIQNEYCIVPRNQMLANRAERKEKKNQAWFVRSKIPR